MVKTEIVVLRWLYEADRFAKPTRIIVVDLSVRFCCGEKFEGKRFSIL